VASTKRGNASKPISLHPLTFEQAMGKLLDVDPDAQADADESPEQQDHVQSATGN
jgi:hypothetical protein